ncbi:hypothetical protein M3638_04805 [Oceanobacillus profundus]|uniref:hypothetical protein n=1 Tax=Oceanobacillus profundus TaxID=372463 RepID=UPI00203BFDB6|nr:hypothetical protein [Oceanobacillus profundus]MCM3397157.1 hypothetical protein [Oceanobacillus profundus]
MKNGFLLVLFLAFSILTGFEHQDKLEITDTEITVIQSEGLLRYDFKIKNNGEIPIESDFDYPGQHPFGIEFVIRPNEKLSEVMVMEKRTNYNKMFSLGSGHSGYFEPNTEMSVHLEYKMKDDVNPEKVKKLAYDSTLLILDGVDIAIEFPLQEIKEKLSN